MYKCISKNKFKQAKKYEHLADNNNLNNSDKFIKVIPLYNLSNKSLQQFGFWHLNYSIDEQMVLDFGLHSAKQTIQNKSVSFGCKNFILTSCGGTLGKDLTVRVVTEMVLKCYVGLGNLTFDNWYTSAKLYLLP